ncbi:hypothetical protein DPMN_116795 [Dreissena polymorpha]|uniref:Uncharacterized protein n=1 Tax=Dreissena polymorpha TaxID=45954 RepID=A0A9D4KQ37_DREPO|nr:hypothetical protein DPMN_116795 [Dreissena polymorpha]
MREVPNAGVSERPDFDAIYQRHSDVSDVFMCKRLYIERNSVHDVFVDRKLD